MANFKQGYILTNAGKALQAKVEAGETLLKVTKMALGSGTVESIDDYAELTDLVNKKYELMVSSVESQDVSCVVKGKINSQTVAEGFDVTELGLFAMDGESEILYCVAYDEDAMYVPGKSDGSAVECEFSIYIQFATADKVEIVLPTSVDEIVKWVQNNALTCETAAEKAEKAIEAADRAEQETLNAGNAAATAESAKEDAVAAKDRAEAIAIEVKEATTAAKTSEENAKASETAAAESAELAKTRADSIKGDVEKAAASASEAATSETNAEESAAKAEAAAQKLTNVFVYKGTVATYAELPTDPETGDVWNITKADKTHGIKAGDNVAWSGEAWDSLGGTCDLSEYALTADQQKDVVNASVNGATVTLIARDGTNTPLTVNDVAHATAADTATKATTADSATTAASATKASQDGQGNTISTTYAKSASLATVATSGSYNDLSNRPSLATVATSGDFNDLSNNTINDILPKTAAAHNSIYRGKDLTSYFNSGGMSTAIAAGTFDDIFPGDYITKSVTVNGTTYSNVKWLVADLDYHLHRGNTETTAHHVVMIPENNLGTSYMNSTNTTAGGYQGSYMWTTTIPLYVTGIVNAFGSTHVLEHDEILTNAMNANAASSAGLGWTGSAYWDWNGTPWQTVTVNIPNQAMMYGNHPLASSGREEGDCNKQLAIFRYGQNFTRAKWCWLRDVAYSSDFAAAISGGYASGNGASIVGGVRPYFLLR